MNQSVISAIELLEELAKFKKPTSLKVLAATCRLDKATAHRLLSSLCYKGLVRRCEHGQYRLGPAFLYFAEIFRSGSAIRERAQPFLERLVIATEETAIYCERLHAHLCVTLERCDSPHQTRTVMDTGLPRHIWFGSSGQAILAMLPEDEMSSLVSQCEFEKFTPYSLVSRKQLQAKLEAIRRAGYAISIQERYEYTAGIAAPVFDEKGVRGSIAIIGPPERIQKRGVDAAGRIVKNVADELSQELGFWPPERSHLASP